MDPLRLSGEQLSLFWHSVETTLQNVSKNLDREFERTYSEKDPTSASSARYNPHKLVMQLRSNDASLPDLRKRAEAVGNVDEWLPTTIASQSSAVAACLLSVVNSDKTQDDDVSTLVGHSKDVDNRIMEVVELHRETWRRYATRRDLLSEAASIDVLIDNETQPPPVLNQSSAESTSEVEGKLDEEVTVKTKTKPKPKPKPKPGVPPSRQRRAVGKSVPAAAKKPTKNSSSGGFVPIEKSAFNRLPRNLKVGKLADINVFYEKIYNVLKDRGPMGEEELLAAVGETKASKLGSLRGLSVLRNGDSGWYLAGSKK